MKLMSMVDYIYLQEHEIPLISNTPKVIDMDRIFVQRIILYMRFLKQNLTLGMFVPCDLYGNVLEEPKDHQGWNLEHYNSLILEHKEAKERVLFEGFEFKGDSDFSFIFKYKGTFPTMIPKLTVEVLANRYKDINLTDTAIKQIRL